MFSDNCVNTVVDDCDLSIVDGCDLLSTSVGDCGWLWSSPDKMVSESEQNGVIVTNVSIIHEYTFFDHLVKIHQLLTDHDLQNSDTYDCYIRVL